MMRMRMSLIWETWPRREGEVKQLLKQLTGSLTTR